MKTYRLQKGFSLPKWYVWQVQVQMFCSGIHRGELVVYGLREQDYGAVGMVDPGRLQRIPVAYDPVWLNQQYLPRHMALVQRMKRGEFPDPLE